MLKHLARVESSWLSHRLLGGTYIAPFDAVDREADAASDRIIAEALAGAEGLDRLSVVESSRGQGRSSLRWFLLHLVEEYAHHNGHADLIRESIDGMTGE